MAVEATLVDDMDTPAGAACGLIYRCPCGCGHEGYLGSRGLSNPARPSWIWDGNRAAPTLSPSIHHQYTYGDGSKHTHWHGWLKAGAFTSV